MAVEGTLSLRTATGDDVPALEALIERSVRVLQSNDYSPDQINGALGTVFGVDTQLIADGTYFVIEHTSSAVRNQIVACGGWSKRKTLFGSDHAPDRESSLLDPKVDAAKIRAFFVHPQWVRQGLGSRILNASEQAAAAAGFTSFEMGATLTGEHLYRTRGYRVVERVEVPLSNGASLPILRMTK